MPAPWNGDLTLDVECRLSRSATRGSAHPIVIHEDWTVDTPHDLEAERVARALGGYCSCVDLIDRVLPRAAPGLDWVARRARPPLHRVEGSWHTDAGDGAGCRGGSRPFPTARAAYADTLRPELLAMRFAVPLWQLAPVVRRVAEVTRPDFARFGAAAALVRGGDLVGLWRAGIHPREVPGMAQWAGPVRGPLPRTYFEAVAYHSHPPDWIAEVLAHRPDPDVAGWLAWLDPPRPDGFPMGPWLALGIGQRDLMVAVTKGVPHARIGEVVTATGWSSQVAGRALAAWARADCFPTAADLALLERRGVSQAPSARAVDAAVTAARRIAAGFDRSTAGVMLALCGNLPEFVHAMQNGVRTVPGLLQHLHERWVS